MFVRLVWLDLDDPLGLGLEGIVSPKGLLQSGCIAAQLVCILLSHLADSEGPAIMGAGKSNIAQLRLELVFFVFQVHFILLGPVGAKLPL